MCVCQLPLKTSDREERQTREETEGERQTEEFMLQKK